MLLAAAALVGAVVFLPVRRRLKALERAAERIGAGDRDVLADDRGRDEIAVLAGAFNRMSAELSARTDALHESDRVRRQMLADVSHELRTPLTAMRGYLDTLAMPDVALDAATRARYLETARREAERLQHIVADLLDLARHEHGAAAIEPRVFAIERVFEHVVRRHERDAEATGVTLASTVSADADQVLADPGRLEQAVGNLVANALRHTPSGGTIRLEAAIRGGRSCLTVEDSGDGIPAAHLAHVFDRFYKADSARTGGHGGSGLGLSIVKAIVERTAARSRWRAGRGGRRSRSVCRTTWRRLMRFSNRCRAELQLRLEAALKSRPTSRRLSVAALRSRAAQLQTALTRLSRGRRRTCSRCPRR